MVLVNRKPEYVSKTSPYAYNQEKPCNTALNEASWLSCTRLHWGKCSSSPENTRRVYAANCTAISTIPLSNLCYKIPSKKGFWNYHKTGMLVTNSLATWPTISLHLCQLKPNMPSKEQNLILKHCLDGHLYKISHSVRSSLKQTEVLFTRFWKLTIN